MNVGRGAGFMRRGGGMQRQHPGRRGLLRTAALLLAAAAVTACGAAPQQRVLRFCADPNNLPFSNERGEGFENQIAEVVARELGARVEYEWHAQRRGFIRNTLRARECDIVAGIPSSFELALATRPYYRSTYVFVVREDSNLDIRSFDDPQLRELRIGVQVIGDDYTNSPPAHALGNRGIVTNITGFSVIGDYAEEAPPARILDAVADGRVDIAIVWGPLAGWYTQHHRLPLRLTPVEPQIDLPFLPFVFDMAMGVRHGEIELREELDDVLQRLAPEIDAILDGYGVPRMRGNAMVRAGSR
jgi:mxaJ protein